MICKYDEAFTIQEMSEETTLCQTCSLDCPNAKRSHGQCVTGRDLINWIKKYHAEDAIVEVAYRDEGGLYYGTDKKIEPLIVGGGVCMDYIGSAPYTRIIL